MAGTTYLDFDDVIVRAEQALALRPYGTVHDELPLAGVIIDEVQDLSCAKLRLLRTISQDAAEDITLIGDGQQSIYPGGYTLSEVGLNVSGRGIVLDINYRNTAQILEQATQVVYGDEYADIEGDELPADVAVRAERQGPVPLVWQGQSDAGHSAMIAHIRELVTQPNVGLGDIAVLGPTHPDVNEAHAWLKAAGIKQMKLENYTGKRSDTVKVGTIHRAKGLEFKHVLVVGARAELLAASDAVGAGGARLPVAGVAAVSDAELEARARHKRELFVAMTRARDSLWVGSWV